MTLPLPSYNDDPKSFAYPTVHKRWPTIIEGAIDDLNLTIKQDPNLAKSGSVIIEKLSKLLKDFKNDLEIEPFTQDDIKLNPSLTHYNDHFSQLNPIKKITWLTGPWLYLECYLYQLIHLFFLQSDEPFWSTFDIFNRLKTKTFQQSESGVLELCKRYQVLHDQLTNESNKIDESLLKILFTEFIDISLWGNATDLSLLAGNVTLEDIKSVQGAEVRKKNEEKIIVNDLPQAWSEFISSKGNRNVDIVLDNSGFELFADLILTLFLLDSKLSNQITIHCKEIPWFVSDTMPKDFDALLNQLIDPSFYPNIHNSNEDSKLIINLHNQLKHYFDTGKLKVSHHSFWTLSYNYWEIPQFSDLYNQLSSSSLIIFKGDLNYRKLTGDLQWDKTTPFLTAIQQLASSKLPILTLRTCKADVTVGLPKGLNEKLIETYKNDGNEVGEFWTSSGKWAVISFSNGNN
ncbi:DUF89-domain-containing protein [Hyphopichia burtonii NRRL Y-1933]|uniref:Sugar phosphate phosphatase n=1 Tax=Hyphopichia burtonii NRRL Y-1933 TaxID=984485 RepID=A0A1E4RGA1_9ASCO|nr:DUF89-domain-containing protein [Hyphopichia burtonii NRRL Y-1933]ODV66283.1 DUF89-domain-containing protein [Hyphopichia burtonii NRRL Y-1933]